MLAVGSMHVNAAEFADQLYRPDLDVRRWRSSNVVAHPIALIT